MNRYPIIIENDLHLLQAENLLYFHKEDLKTKDKNWIRGIQYTLEIIKELESEIERYLNHK
jgi:hypothetical protein